MNRSIIIAAFALLAAACLPPGRAIAPASPHSIAYQGDPNGIYEAEVKAIADAGLSLGQQDRASGVVQTQWHETYHGGYSLIAPPTRRIMFVLSQDQSQIVIAPKVELCDARGICHKTDKLTDKELAVSDQIASSLESELQARNELAPKTEVVLQSGTTPAPIVVAPPPQQQPQVVYVPAPAPGPARPSQQGPVVIRTRVAGMQEIVAGRSVEIELSNGNRLTGKITAVSPEGLTLDSGTGDDVVIWAKDIAQVITR